MFQRILVPLDGSERAERIVPVALRLARSNGGTIILLRVINPNQPLFSQTMPSQELLDEARAEAKDYLEALSRSEPFQGVRTEIVLPFGSAGATILTAAMLHHADIVIINSHGDTGMSRWVMGSVADKVTRYAEMPVLLFRDRSALPLGPHPDPSEPLRVLVPLDGSELATTALEPAAELLTMLSSATNNALHLIRAVDTREKLPAARDYLQAITARIESGQMVPIIARQQIAVTWSVAINADPADAIVRVAENGEDAENSGVFGGCDLVAITTHGLTGLPFWTMGSVTERVRAATQLPMLIIRPADMGNPIMAHPQDKLESVAPER
ncbi:universal stress protein [Tengunoibacter tsumagoiensis]|uniref:Universal stress protein UspA n=1 Tax=Tengunoibacter tsumagoiensis TaxID=2014871 RepID=A0A401ZXQ2_9CHLR|nr:universal stress protein [Tengunoibacter tsumagoiensis]GCE11617.1 universal stress protein UspA [Tengunoibacter tsumagoiensis]